MALSEAQKASVTTLLEKKLQEKLRKYARETSSMPFLLRLVQDSEKIAAYSFIHSIATTLGMSIYEEVSKIVASESAELCLRNFDVGGALSRDQKSVIDDVITRIRNGEKAVNHDDEVQLVLDASPAGGKAQKERKIADFYMVRGGIEHFFEIKTVKPNKDVFTASKVKLLEWIARRRRSVKVYLAFPYNPYYPNDYPAKPRFAQVVERRKEFLIGAEYWDFLGGENTFEELLVLFEDVGKRFKERILEKIQKVAAEKMERDKFDG